MVEMAGTAPACKEVLSACIPVYDSFLGTFSGWKMTKSQKKLISYTHTLRTEESYGVRPISTTLSYKLEIMKFVAGHTALIPWGKATLLCD
jgi:hypothetical protein